MRRMRWGCSYALHPACFLADGTAGVVRGWLGAAVEWLPVQQGGQLFVRCCAAGVGCGMHVRREG